MAKASMDIESEVDWHELDNALTQTKKEASNRYDFKGSAVDITFNKEDSSLTLNASNEMQLSALEDMLVAKMHKRGVDSRCLDAEKLINSSHKEVRQKFKINSGLSKDDGKKIVKEIKKINSKIQASVNDTKVSVVGKSRDELQDIMKKLRESDVGLPLQFKNFKS